MKTLFQLQCPSFEIVVLATTLGEAATYADKHHGTVSAARQLKGEELHKRLDEKTYFEA